MSTEPASPRFRDLALIEPLLQALDEVGYENPSPIQAATIPVLLEGRDVLGQAQTGTGKTAAFALPIISRLDLLNYVPQCLVLAPTRELAIQVAEAFKRYAKHLERFHVLPVYGGQAYGAQLGGLRRGVHVVVGTPGRVIDHIERGTLKLDALTTLVLDEADEMLRMGFIDDVEKILSKTPPTRQVALFSATMPPQIRRIAQTYMRNPAEITIKSKTTTATNIRQRYWMVAGVNKLDALTRMLEAEGFDGMIIFCRTKQATSELAEKLEARGFSAVALNGDIEQKQRERTVARLKNGEIDIIVATDVAARGLDVERISHVINYDVPTDPESYTHRIGRTGRAGRSGDAILFVAPRERNLLRMIERATRQPITPMELPSLEAAKDRRVAKFKDSIVQTLGDSEQAHKLSLLRGLIEQVERDFNVPATDIAAALALTSTGNSALIKGLEASGIMPGSSSSVSSAPAKSPPPATPYHQMADSPAPARPRAEERPRPAAVREEASVAAPRPAAPAPRAEAPARPAAFEERAAAPPKRERFERERPERSERPERAERPRRSVGPEAGFETYRIEVGHQHGVKPGNIVGAIANEADLDSKHIGRVQIFDDHSLVDLPEGMPKETFKLLQGVWVVGQRLLISKPGSESEPATLSLGAKKHAGHRKFDRDGGAPRKHFGDKSFKGEKKSFGDRPHSGGGGKSFADRGDRKSFGDKPSFGEKKSFGERGGKPFNKDKKPFSGGGKFSPAGGKKSFRKPG